MDPYRILGLDAGASKEDIKKAYRTLAKKYHPDMNGGDDAKFKEVNEAYSQLTSEPEAASDPFSFFKNFESMFGMRFGSNPFRETFSRRGADLKYVMSTSFYDLVAGASKEIEVSFNDICSSCSGNGATSFIVCPSCKGSGFLRQQVTPAQFSAISCPSCGGKGKRPSAVCNSCKGTGSTLTTKRITVNIPAGTDPAASLCLRGEGGKGTNGGPAGDLVIIIKTMVPDKNRLSVEDLEVLKKCCNG